MFEVKNQFKIDLVNRIKGLKDELALSNNKVNRTRLTILINQLQYEVDCF